MSSIKKAVLVQSQVSQLECRFIRHLKSLEELDLSENELSDGFIDFTECPDAFKKLSTLKLSHNRFQTYKDVCHSLENLTSLVDLDLSHNDFSVPPSACSWHQMFGVFNLSDTKLQQIQNYLPSKVEVLDLSNNNLLLFSASPQGLRELYLSNNRLLVLPALHDMPNLQILQIDGNDLTTFSERDIEDLKQLQAVTARRNSYHCDCSSKDTIDSLVKMSSILKDWPDDYVCGSPSLRQGTHVKDLNLSFFAKRRTVKATTDLNAKFDAFISYSESDSEWVDNFLVPQLENTNEPFKLCLHMWDFLPEKWIMDNIIESIEESRKTLFVISKHFVSSKWCKYELEFSQHRFFDENNDFVILVLLEPIPRECIPHRFCKLHKLMSKNTYLEWLEEDDQQGIFWEKLRTALTSQ
ncbi:UNVERIFIED_CONTAM: hypothetical protein FKN15_027770 [Acipenser sinensis]